MTPTAIATDLWLYPVQSLRGQRMETLDFDTERLPFDRWYGIENAETGEMVGASSAKRDWRPLITWDAAYLGPLDPAAPAPKVEIRFPDGSHVVSDDPLVDKVLSDRLARSVALRGRDGVRAATRYRVSPCHLLTTATLRKLKELYPAGDFAPERFRPNVVLDTGETTGFIEQAWLGHRVTASSGVIFEGTEDCKRCGLTTRAQGALPSDPTILHTIMHHNHTSAGFYAKVTAAGRIARGDTVRVD